MWRLTAQMLIFTLTLNSTASSNNYVVVGLTVTPLWNVAVNKSDVASCSLIVDNNLQDVVRFTGDTRQICSVQLTLSNGTATLIRIPQGVLLFAERQLNIHNCQMKYVSFVADEPCFFVSRHPELQLFLEGYNANSNSIDISQIPVNTSAPICLDVTGSKGQHTSRVSQSNYCQTHEFDQLISCYPISILHVHFQIST